MVDLTQLTYEEILLEIGKVKDKVFQNGGNYQSMLKSRRFRQLDKELQRRSREFIKDMHGKYNG